MPSTFKTPGVFIAEKNAFPSSVVPVETALPVFIGYTGKAERAGHSLLGEPVRLTSFAEYTGLYGESYPHLFDIDSLNAGTFVPSMLSGPLKRFYLYDCIRLFYQNGGADCYMLSLGTYADNNDISVSADDIDRYNVFTKLQQTPEPTLVIVPDFVTDKNSCYPLYKKMLKHCSDMRSRLAILDVIPGEKDAGSSACIQAFRDAIGSEGLSYGAAYYPWLNTSIVPAGEINFMNLNIPPKDLQKILPEPKVKEVLDQWESFAEKNAGEDQDVKNAFLHNALLHCSPVYNQIMDEIRVRLNLLPPSAAMAGIYTMIDNSRGVWKAPANVSLSGVISPAENITPEEQEDMNVTLSGKSVNAIRSFTGEGTLVWGARTLDGNSSDWRYINVRRTLMMIEQSIKPACQAYVFEPNVAGTWVIMKNMIQHFLTGLWKQGGLAGASAEDAFSIHLGLGETMTPEDVSKGMIRITVLVALSRPAEFIEISIEQQQKSV